MAKITKDNPLGLSEYDLWERKVIDDVIILLQCPNGDAQGVVEAASFAMSKAWSTLLTPRNTAELICKIETIDVLSSNGTLRVNKQTGGVIHCDMDEDGEGIDQITKVNLEEWKQYHPDGDLSDGIDILDVGIWTKDGSYDEPDKDYRRIHKEENLSI